MALSSVLPSPSSASAPVPGSVVSRASFFGASFFGLRPSVRSFSGWVGVAVFSARSAASLFARVCSVAWRFPFCAVRPCSGGFRVSVPVFVSSPPSVAAGSLPCFWWGLGSGGGGSVPPSSPSPAPSGVPAPSPSAPPLPPAVSVALFSASCLGFSGSRSVVPPVLSSVLFAVPVSPAPSVLVGCARGVDSSVRAFFGSRCSVFSASSFGRGRGSFAARSVAFVSALSAAGGVLFSFPSSAYPVGLRPSSRSSACFCGLGSGSWASLAFAVGCGVRCFVFLPAGVSAPGWLSPVGGGWFSAVPAGSQLSLF